jgi:predicted MFS family arabinose efflux permease
MSFIEDALEEEGFYILAGIGLGAEIMGFIFSKKIGYAFPIWQFIILIIGTLFACAFFSTRD